MAQKHYAVTCSVSSSLARIADAEWARCCESIRKSSPQIGSLGEWRSFCDVGWMGKIPDDLPDAETPAATGPSLAALPAVEEELVSDTDLGVNKTSPTNISRDYTPSDVPPAPPPPMVDPGPSQHDSGTVKSDIPALDHFPAPPVHFPLPHLRGALKSPLDGPFENPPSYGRRMTSPVSPTQESSSPTPMTPTQPVVAAARQTLSPATNLTAEQPIHLPTSSRSDPVSPRSDPHQLIPSADLQTAVLTSDNSEFGIRQSHPPPGLPGPTSLPKGSPRNSGVVLAMRNRFSQNVSYGQCVYAIYIAEVRSLFHQLHREKLRLQSFANRSVYRPPPVDINLVVSILQYVRTGFRRGQPLNLLPTTRMVPMYWWVFRRVIVNLIF